MVCMYELMYSCLIKNPSDMILVNNLSFYDRGVTIGIRAISKLSTR
jgi:hypothetical protein